MQTNVPGCYWQRDVAPTRSIAPLTGEQTADVVIIGGGYTGLSSAYYLKKADSAIRVVVLEAQAIGHGASGRNAGFVMKLFGSSAPMLAMLHGKQRLREAHDYMIRAIDNLEQLVTTHNIDCDFERSDFLRVATTPAYEARAKSEIELMQSAGIDDLDWIEKNTVQNRINSPSFLGACVETGCATLDPVKWLRGLHDIAKAAGARIYEGTRVTRVKRAAGQFRVETPNGIVRAQIVVYALNAYAHLMPQLRRTQAPAFTYVAVTEPLNETQRASLNWQGREGFEDGRNFMHYCRLTPDNRLLMGGGPGVLPFGNRMDFDNSPEILAHLVASIEKTFPQLRGIKVDYHWGGAFSMTPDFTPQIGLKHGGAAVYSVGCTGHGVALTQMNGRIVRDLVLERKTDLTDLWFVNHTSLPMPPEPIRSAVANLVAAGMALDDWWCDRAAA